MSTWDMVKFWLIQGMLPMLIALAVVVVFVIGVFAWAFILTVREWFSEKWNKRGRR